MYKQLRGDEVKNQIDRIKNQFIVIRLSDAINNEKLQNIFDKLYDVQLDACA